MREKIRTPDTLVRSQVLYPAELRTHILFVLLVAMPATGIEPVLYFYNRILSPARLPVPPRRLVIMSGTNRARTYDPLLVRQMLSQLSYDPRIVTTLLTTPAGLEPATSAVTGRRSNQLSHEAIYYFKRSGPSGTRTQDRPVMSRLL